jgi:hypothetical protein
LKKSLKFGKPAAFPEDPSNSMSTHCASDYPSTARCHVIVGGCGSVARCTMPLLLKILTGPTLAPRSITVIDCLSPSPALHEWFECVNIKFEKVLMGHFKYPFSEIFSFSLLLDF